jgi:hypothetical protein
VLPGIRIDRQYQGYPVGARGFGRVHRNLEDHQVIVDRKDFFHLPVVEIHRIVVLHILEDVHILPPDGFQYLGLDLAVGETGEPCRDFEPGGPEFLDVPGEMGGRGDGVVDEIDPVGNILYIKVVALCQIRGCPFKNTPVSLLRWLITSSANTSPPGQARTPRFAGLE